MTCDAYDSTGAEWEGSRQSYSTGVEGRWAESESGYINAHGTSTTANDSTETAAIKKAVGEYAYKVAISSTKSMTGHLWVLRWHRAVATVMAIATTKSTTINLSNPDPECDLDYVPSCRAQTVDVALSNSFGFGGHHVSIQEVRLGVGCWEAVRN